MTLPAGALNVVTVPSRARTKPLACMTPGCVLQDPLLTTLQYHPVITPPGVMSVGVVNVEPGTSMVT
jgi:hypothetical protein